MSALRILWDRISSSPGVRFVVYFWQQLEESRRASKEEGLSFTWSESETERD